MTFSICAIKSAWMRRHISQSPDCQLPQHHSLLPIPQHRLPGDFLLFQTECRKIFLWLRGWWTIAFICFTAAAAWLTWKTRGHPCTIWQSSASDCPSHSCRRASPFGPRRWSAARIGWTGAVPLRARAPFLQRKKGTSVLSTGDLKAAGNSIQQ